MMMKRYVQGLVVGLFVATLCMGCGSNSTDNGNSSIADNNKTASNPGAQNPEPAFEFEHTEWDFKRINEGEQVKHVYRFTNVGNEELVIRDVKASCGCTIPEWDKRPIPAGEKGSITVAFDSKGKPGNQSKTVTITANTNPPTTMLTFRAMVMPNE